MGSSLYVQVEGQIISIRYYRQVGKKYKIREFEEQRFRWREIIPEVFEFSTSWENEERTYDSLFIISGMITTNKKSREPNRQTLPRELVLPGADMCIWLSRPYFGKHLLKKPIENPLNSFLKNNVYLSYNSSGTLFTSINQPYFKIENWDVKLIKLNVTANNKLTLYLKAQTNWKNLWSRDRRYTLESTAYVYVKPDGEGIKFDFVKGPSKIDPDERRGRLQKVVKWATFTLADYIKRGKLDFELDSVIDAMDFSGKIMREINGVLNRAKMDISYLEEADAQVSHAGLSTSGQMYLCMKTK
eukprot:TRINITY_DN116_c0_g1_i7.p3 TRINITY_DN116_c0_g1~~TRINITY_DN116_c0_g1_i7.p3  ORF type:complete len:301 (-),score=14.67 TRINITY_DN116_c0_g1_i7:691-1593(-)